HSPIDVSRPATSRAKADVGPKTAAFAILSCDPGLNGRKMQLRTQGKCFATLPNRFDYFGPDGPIAVIATRLASPLSTFRRALLYFYPDRWLVAGLLGLTCLGTLLGLLQVWPLAWLVDGVLAQRQLSWWP